MKMGFSSIEFERVHRIGRLPEMGGRQPGAGTKARPIVAKFSKFKDREAVRKLSYALKGKPFGIQEQYPELITRRK